MSMRPLIGLTGRRKLAQEMVGSLDILADAQFDMFYAEYSRAVLEAGGLPVNLPLDADPADLVPRLDGLLLSGGADIGPERYDARPDPDAPLHEPGRDDFELALFGEAAAAGVPVLGICRGLQIMNVHSGGTLHQHVPAHQVFSQPRDTESRAVSIEADSALAEMYGTEHKVNSLHHQTVDQLGANLRISARAHDGAVEGLEHTELPMLAVQWHPEMLRTRASDPVFGWLVRQAALYARR
ncbi:MAG: gamma-glutamyl-gamma-aminobutyrate hydrolase family protein [Acidimicrobiales bacterium]